MVSSGKGMWTLLRAAPPLLQVRQLRHRALHHRPQLGDGRHLGRKRQQPWPMANPRRRGERRGGEDIPPERSPLRRRRYAGVEASSCGVLGRRWTAESWRGVGRRRLHESSDGVSKSSSPPLEPSELRGNKWIEGKLRVLGCRNPVYQMGQRGFRRILGLARLIL